MAAWRGTHTLCIALAIAASTSVLAGCAPSYASRATSGGGSSMLQAQRAQGVQFEAPPPSAAAPKPRGPVLQQDVVVATSARTERAAFAPEAEADAAVDAPSRSATARTAGGGWEMNAGGGAPLFAQAPGTAKPKAPASEAAVPTGGGEEAAAVATDGRSGPLLIYEAQLWMAVYEVDEKQAEVIALVKELGGFLSQQTGRRLVVRVPAARFQEAIDGIEKVGDVVERNIQAQDVTDQFRDLTLRLENAERVRERLAALLVKAQGVKESLEIERELDRLTERIEMLKGQLKALSDRIAFSTITVEFGVRAQPSIDPEFNLPFGWLQRLGLDTLLTL